MNDALKIMHHLKFNFYFYVCIVLSLIWVKGRKQNKNKNNKNKNNKNKNNKNKNNKNKNNKNKN
jgi:hypothetical protein